MEESRAPLPPGSVYQPTAAPYVETAYHVAGEQPVTKRQDRQVAPTRPAVERRSATPLPAGEDFAIQTMYRFPKNPVR